MGKRLKGQALEWLTQSVTISIKIVDYDLSHFTRCYALWNTRTKIVIVGSRGEPIERLDLASTDPYAKRGVFCRRTSVCKRSTSLNQIISILCGFPRPNRACNSDHNCDNDQSPTHRISPYPRINSAASVCQRAVTPTIDIP
jgi:hypothetical protein